MGHSSSDLQKSGMRFLWILACAIEARKLNQPALSSVKEFLSVLELLITALMTCLLESILSKRYFWFGS
jgi:hypothetical protein